MNAALIDAWCAGALTVAGSAVAIRARMLRPRQAPWTCAPRPVWIGLSALALALLMAAVSLLAGAHASPREAMVDSLLAGVSLVMLWNLDRHGRQEDAERARIRREVDHLLELAPPARYPWER